jgi:hypothetical protein
MTWVIVRLIWQIPCIFGEVVYAEGLSRQPLRGVENLYPGHLRLSVSYSIRSESDIREIDVESVVGQE